MNHYFLQASTDKSILLFSKHGGAVLMQLLPFKIQSDRFSDNYSNINCSIVEYCKTVLGEFEENFEVFQEFDT